MRKLPISTRFDGIDVKSVFGQPLFGMYQQINRILFVDPRGNHLLHFFSEPSIQRTDGSINWYTRAEGPIRSWWDLTQSEQGKALQIVDRNCRLVDEICEHLQASQGNSSATIEALKAMLVTPGLQESLCVVGQTVVLTQWGCRPFGSAASEFALEVQGKQAIQFDSSRLAVNNSEEIEYPAPPVIAETSSKDISFDTFQESAVEEPAKEVPEAPDGPPHPEPKPQSNSSLIWRWVTILTLLALLLIGLILRGCAPALLHTEPVGPNDLKQTAELIMRADEKLLECRPPVESKPSPDTINAVPSLTPEALSQNEVRVFNGSWILRSDSGLTIENQPIAMQIDFDQQGRGRTFLKADDGTTCRGKSEVLIKSSNSFRMSLSALTCIGSFAAVSENQADCNVSGNGQVANCVLRCLDGPCDAEFLRN